MDSSNFHQRILGLSHEKREISLISSEKNISESYLFIGGVHGDEPEGPRLAKDLWNWLQKNHSSKLHPWALIKDINPDGSHKNQRTNAQGVDLNRNFPTPHWTPKAKEPRYFPGPHPASEVETRLLMDLLQAEPPKCVIHFHSWNPSLTYTGAISKPYAEILAKGTSYPVQDDIGYATPGSLGEYCSLVLKRPVVCLEAQEFSDLNSLWPIFSQGLIELLQKTSA